MVQSERDKPASPLDDEYREDEAWERSDPDEEAWDFYEGECHMDSRGQCGLAGSEWCEFECPFRR